MKKRKSSIFDILLWHIISGSKNKLHTEVNKIKQNKRHTLTTRIYINSIKRSWHWLSLKYEPLEKLPDCESECSGGDKHDSLEHMQVSYNYKILTVGIPQWQTFKFRSPEKMERRKRIPKVALLKGDEEGHGNAEFIGGCCAVLQLSMWRNNSQMISRNFLLP